MIHVKYGATSGLEDVENLQCCPADGDHVHVFGRMGDTPNRPQVAVLWTMGTNYHSLHHAEKTKRAVALLRLFKDDVFKEVADAITAEHKLKRM